MFIPFGDDVEKNSAPFVVLCLIMVNMIIAVYTADVMHADETGEATMAYFMEWGIVPANLEATNCYTVVTSMFLHGGFMHIFGNMLMFWALGPTLEELLGHGKLLTLYLVSGLIATGVYFGMHMESEIPCVGASGAISGIIGAYCMACGPDTKIKTILILRRVHRIDIPAVVYAMFYMVTQYFGFMTAVEGTGGVAFSAHLGGFGGGMLLMGLLQDPNKQIVDQWGHKRIRTNGEFEEYEEVTELESAEDPDAETEPAPLEMQCTYCNQELSYDDEIAPKLFRCSSAECGRMNFDASGIPEKKSTVKQYI